MKRIITSLILFGALSVSFAQTNFDRTIPYRAGQSIMLDFTFPEIIKLETHDVNEIKIEGTVTINSGLYDEKFDLEVETSGNTIEIFSMIKDKDEIPRRITVNISGKEYVIMASSWDDPKVKEFLAQHDKGNVNWMSHGMDIDVELTVTVPRNSSVDISSKFGTIEIHSMPDQLVASSQHDGVDIHVNPSSRLDFEIHTTFGEVYTNLDLDLEEQDGLRPYKAQTLNAHLNGGGKKVILESKFGNVYLRSRQ